jgi:acyl-[acyl-carrier-protein]-phospholipid O-acyltransferase / long-chain-fatty-acid--[acyl-carrier-protein] ligase
MSDDLPGDEPSRRAWLGYWSMIVQQTQNAFNDKAAQFILIPLAGAVAFSFQLGGGLAIGVESAAGLMIALPFILFAPVAGWLSDRFSKRDVMLGAAVAQVVILGWICVAVMMRSLPQALAGFFALAVQSAFFSPAKIGINKELVGSRHLGFAAGIQQMTAMLAILVGQIAAGYLFDQRFSALGGTAEVAWRAALVPLLVVAALSLPAVVLAWLVPRVPAQANVRLTPRLAVSHFAHVAELWREAGLRRASFGVAFFWGFASFINLWSLKLAKELTGGGEGFGTMSSMFMAAASLGMVGGFGVAAMLLRRRIELGWVPVAGVAMSLISLALAFISPEGSVFLLALGALAFFAALFLAPLNAWMQDNYPPAKRGELQAAVNLVDCFAGILAIGAIELMAWGAAALGFQALTGYRFQIAFIGIACGLMAWFIIRLLPGDFIRVIGVALIRTIYRIQVVNPERLPAKGGVLLLPNHVTFADAFFISAACPRPVRFVMDEAFMASRAIRAFVSIFDTVTIRRDQPREAIRRTIEALESGDLVCLFPEGQLTRTGTLSSLRRGFELIARKAGHPVMPLWCDGAWGSIFSFEGGRYFRKRPTRVPFSLVIAFGEIMPPESAEIATVRAAMLRASAEAVARRFARRPDPAAINAHQISQMDALRRGSPISLLAADPRPAELPALAVFSRRFGARLESRADGSGVAGQSTWLGGSALRNWLQNNRPAGGVIFHDFSPQASDTLELDGVLHCPGLAAGGLVLAMSMPDPPPADGGAETQPGRRPGTLGKLLPGWFVETGADGRLWARGPAAPGGLLLPEGCRLDPDGFIAVAPAR